MIKKTFIAVFAIIFVLLNVCICVFTANTWMELKDNSVYARSDMDTHVYIYKSCYDSVPDNARPYIYPKNVKGILDKRDALPTKDEAIRVAEIIFFLYLKMISISINSHLYRSLPIVIGLLWQSKVVRILVVAYIWRYGKRTRKY